MSLTTNAIDRKWFMDRLQSQGKSVRGLARHLEKDPSAVSRMLSGTRRLRLEEVPEVARYLSAPVEEVLQRTGLPIDDRNPAILLLSAAINRAGEVVYLPDPKPLPEAVTARVRAAVDGDDPAVAAQVRAADGALSIWDDAVVLFRPGNIIAPDAIGTLAVCRTADGRQLLAHLERARKTGEATVRLPDGTTRDVTLSAASPVLAVVP